MNALETLGPQIVERYAPHPHAASRPAATAFPLTDLGNAERLVDDHAERIRFVPKWGRWLTWDGRQWNGDDDGGIFRFAKKTVRKMHREAVELDDYELKTATIKHALRSERRERVRAMIASAESDERIIVSVDDLDAEPMLLNVENGIVDLKAGTLLPHDPGRLQTKLAPVEYHPDAPAPTFEAFLERIFAGNRELIGFVQRAVGYSLTGDTSEQCLFLCHGTGANGKSTLFAPLHDLLGPYGVTTPAESLLSKRNPDAIPNDIARLQGTRFVTASETEDGRRLAEGRIKAITGGDRISARFMRGEYFDFRPHFKLWLATNHLPEIRGVDHGIWRRIRLVPFEVTIPEGERDARLPEKLREELPGILAWAVRGCLEWQRVGLNPPAAVTVATNDYRSDSDHLQRFLEERCVVGESFEGRASALYSAYKAWCQEAGETPVSSHAFGRRLSERGYSKRHTRDGKVYGGIGLRAQM